MLIGFNFKGSRFRTVGLGPVIPLHTNILPIHTRTCDLQFINSVASRWVVYFLVVPLYVDD